MLSIVSAVCDVCVIMFVWMCNDVHSWIHYWKHLCVCVCQWVSECMFCLQIVVHAYMFLSSAYICVSVYYVWIFVPYSDSCELLCYVSQPFIFFQGDDCDEEDFCAISTNWTYDRRMRRWRRLNSAVDILRLSDSPTAPQDVSLCDVSDQHDVCSIHSSSSTESEGHRDAAASTTASATATASTTDDHETSRSSSRCSSTNKTPSLDTSFSGPPSPGGSGGGSSTMILEAEGCFPDKPPRKKGTSLLRKMEKLRLRGTTGLFPSIHSGGSNSGSLPRHVTSGPVLVQEEERMERLHCPSRWGLWIEIIQKPKRSFKNIHNC